MAEDCIFCKIADHETNVPLLYDGELVAAFRDINPVAPTHILIVPKKHIPDIRHLADVDAEMLGCIYEVAADLARQEGIDEDGYRLVINTGRAAGQTVPHLHIHLLGGREMGWPPG